MEYFMWAVTLVIAFNFGRFTKSYPTPDEMLRRLLKGKTDAQLLLMTKEVFENEIDKVNRKLLDTNARQQRRRAADAT